MIRNPSEINEQTPWQEMTVGGEIWGGGTARTVKTGEWRSDVPVWEEEKCRQCLLCAPFCPDASIPVQEGKRLGFDLDHCKGCGICAKTCTHGAIVLDNHVAYIDFTKCKLCRECEALCPTGAINGVNFPKELDKEAVKARVAERNKKAKEAEEAAKAQQTNKQ